MRGAIDTVVFDLGNVLIPWNPRFLYAKLFGGRTEEMEWFLSNVCTMAWNETFDSERPFAEGVAELVPRFPRYAHLIEAYAKRWDEMLGEPVAENVSLLGNLKEAGYPVYALSNWPAEKFGVARERFAFLSLFDGMVVSGEVGVRKPDPGIFRILIERHGIEPPRAVFIDDTAGHVTAARKLGFAGIRYEDPAQLRRELKNLGIG